MTLKIDLESEVKAIFESTWEEREERVVPDSKDLKPLLFRLNCL